MSYRVNNYNSIYARHTLHTNYRKTSLLLNKDTSKVTSSKLNQPINKSSLEKNFSANEELSFKGNVIDIQQDHNYLVKTLLHGYTQISVEDNHSRLLFNKLNPNVDSCDYFTDEQYYDMATTNELIDFLSGDDPVEDRLDLIRIFFPECKDVAARLESLGIEPDKYFEIKGQPEKLFLDSDSGWTYTKTEIQNLNKGYNTTNYSKMGYTKDSIFTIDGKEYHLNDKGYLSVPSDVICIPSRVTIKK